MTDADTIVYASKVPMDMNSTNFSRSKRRAISAEKNPEIARLTTGT